MSKPTTADELMCNLRAQKSMYLKTKGGARVVDEVVNLIQTQAEEIKELEEKYKKECVTALLSKQDLDDKDLSLEKKIIENQLVTKDLATLRSALEMYADEDNWDVSDHGLRAARWFDAHGYTLAQEALAKIQGAK